MKTRSVLFLLFAAASMFVLSSCGDYVGKEKTHPLFVKAGTAKSAGNYQEAAKCYEDFLLICPKSAVTHFELASVYGDNLDSPLKAVYHYEKYLEMNPNDSTNAEDIKNFATAARKNLFKKMMEEYKNDPSLMKGSAEETEKIKERLDKYIAYSKALEEQNTIMKQRLRTIAGERTEAGKATAKTAGKTGPAKTAGEAAASTGKTAKTAAAPAAAGATSYKVVAGDTLVSVSRKIYGSPKYYKLIADANKDVLGKSMQLRVGQTLKVPALPAER